MRLTKKLGVGFAVVAAVTSVFALTACGDKIDEAETKSQLYGTFTYQETLGLGDSRLRLTNDADKVITDRSYIYSTVYPLNFGCENTNIAYNMDQRLKLNRDYTYKYDYTITLTNPGDWGATFARFAVSITGTFDFREAGAGKYNVLLGNPTGGTQTVYASHIARQDIYGWSMHAQPDMVTDYSVVPSVENYQYDHYVCSRMAVVNKSDKSLKDNVFYTDLFDYINQFSTY